MTQSTYVRKADSRGKANFGWLDSKHSFSFGSYHDPAHMGISALRVINDDHIAPGAGFDTHGHRDMEIITYVTEGALEHKDTLGNKSVTHAGEVQRMTAGTGIMHSEFNHSQTEPVKLLQIWIQPNQRDLEPGYEQSRIEQQGQLTPLVTPVGKDGLGKDGTLKIHQSAAIHRLQLAEGESFELVSNRTGYLHLVSGSALINESEMTEGDALGTPPGTTLAIQAQSGLEALWFDLP